MEHPTRRVEDIDAWHWHMKKEITIADAIAIVTAVCSVMISLGFGIASYYKMDNRITILEVNKLEDRALRENERVDRMASINRLEAFMDRRLERIEQRIEISQQQIQAGIVGMAGGMPSNRTERPR